jgi:menaquinol-cytochrome c reductase iron-sulfur subunit
MSISIPTLTRKLMTREGFLGIFTLSFGALGGLAVGIPIIAYIFVPLFKQPPERWQTVTFSNGPKSGKTITLSEIAVGDTVEASFEANGPVPWAGRTAVQAAWLRRTGQNSFIAYAVYCTHLGCPIHWLNDAKIFLCPCHGSVFNADGTVAGGPAPRPLFHYETRVVNGRVQIKTHPLPIYS